MSSRCWPNGCGTSTAATCRSCPPFKRSAVSQRHVSTASRFRSVCFGTRRCMSSCRRGEIRRGRGASRRDPFRRGSGVSRHCAARLRTATGLLRDGVESPWETVTRLVLVESGYPEPAVNFQLVSGERKIARLDLADLRARIAYEYDGDGHRKDKRQWRLDVTRSRAIQGERWSHVRLTVADLEPATGLETFTSYAHRLRAERLGECAGGHQRCGKASSAFGGAAHAHNSAVSGPGRSSGSGYGCGPHGAGWQLGHQAATRSLPCRPRRMRVPQRRHGLPYLP